MLFIKEKPLKTTGGMERLSEESADTAEPVEGGTLPRVEADA